MKPQALVVGAGGHGRVIGASLRFLGIEIAAGYARMCAGRLAVAEATNALIIHGDAQRLVRSMLPDASLAAIHVYFPDPWWKARHRKRRVDFAVPAKPTNH